MRKIYASTACLPNQPLVQKIRSYVNAGIRNIELGVGISMGEQDISSLIDLKHSENISFLIHNYFPPAKSNLVLNLASQSEQIRTDSIEFVKNAIDLCEKLDSPFYSVHAGFITDPVFNVDKTLSFPYPKDPDAMKKADDSLLRSIDTIQTYLKDKKTMLLLENNVCNQENKGKLIFQIADEIHRILTNTNESIALLLDVGHLNVTVNTFNKDFQHQFKSLLSLAKGIHLHANNGILDQHQPVTMEDTIFDYVFIQSKINFPIIIEASFNELQDLKKHYYELESKIKI